MGVHKGAVTIAFGLWYYTFGPILKSGFGLGAPSQKQFPVFPQLVMRFTRSTVAFGAQLI